MKRLTLISCLLALGMIMILNIPIASASLSDGLIAYYPFDGNALDASGNNNDGTEYGGLNYKLGIKGDSISFDGIDDYIRVPSDPSLNPVDQLSISFWVKVEGFTNTWSPIIHKGGPLLTDCRNREYSVWLQDTSSFLLASAGDNSPQHYNYACCAILDHWTHYVGIIDRQNNRMQVYVDGVLIVDGNDPYSTFNTNSEDLIFGWTEEVSSAYSPFKGRIDELRIYDRVLSEEEINILSKDATPTIIGCNNTRFCTLEELFNGCSFQVGNLLMTNWELVNAVNVNVSNIDIGPGYNNNTDEFGVWSKNDELHVSQGGWGTPETLNLSFDFLVTGMGVDITQVAGDLGASSGSGFWYDSPWITGSIAVGTSKGSNDLGSTTDVVSLNQNPGTVWIDIPNGRNEIWVRNTISLSSSRHGYARAGYYDGEEVAAFRNRFTTQTAASAPPTIGETIQIPSNYEFILEQSAQEDFSIQLTNPSDDSQSATLEIINPHSVLTVSTTQQNPITLAPAEVLNIPIVINAIATPVGIYDNLLLKLTVENGETLYSNIKVTVVEQSAENLPDLSLHADDIQLADYTLGESATLKALIHNKGQSTASNVQVQFYEFGNLLGETVIEEVPAEGIGTTSITASITTSGEHLIRVVIDSSETIPELDETNNEACRIVQLGSPPEMMGNILVAGSLPSKVNTDSLFTITGHAVYDLYVDGTRYTNYVVKGGAVQITIKGDGGTEWVYGDVHTDINGNFSKVLQAPASPETYRIIMTVTDKTFIGKRELEFSVTEPLPPSTPPPLPPTSSGSGTWTYSGDTDTWNWTWTTPPHVHEPSPESDLRVYSENIYFSKTNPAPDEEITVFAEILYWASSTDLVAQDVPVNFHVTYPGTPKIKIGETMINSLSVGAPDFGSRYVYTTWKNRHEGVYIVEVEIDPSYVEENQLNNAATRAIIVGQIQSFSGVISGQVTDPWGGVGDVIIELYDSSGTTFLENKLTDDTGYYLFENVPVDEYQVHIIKPDGYQVDAETKTAVVSDQSVTEVDFHLTKHNPPVADAGGPYTGSVGSPVTFDAGGSYDPDGQIVSYEWDWDGDDTYDETTSSSTITHTWDTEFSGTIRLKVTDNDGLSAMATASAEITAAPAAGLCCDLDGDGNCDYDDYGLFVGAYGKYAGDPGFIPEADYDGDGRITLVDYQKWYECWKEYYGL
jgi:Concanavalin A-like lectin/glucanases superfamily/CARDB/PKD domain/SdrD B-like domain